MTKYKILIKFLTVDFEKFLRRLYLIRTDFQIITRVVNDRLVSTRHCRSNQVKLDRSRSRDHPSYKSVDLGISSKRYQMTCASCPNTYFIRLFILYTQCNYICTCSLSKLSKYFKCILQPPPPYSSIITSKISKTTHPLCSIGYAPGV